VVAAWVTAPAGAEVADGMVGDITHFTSVAQAMGSCSSHASSRDDVGAVRS
jgi:hypothetical protein